MSQRTSSVGYRPVRRDQLRQDSEHDSYRLAKKPAEPAVCPDCGAIFHAGRWQWGARAEAAGEVLCPACHRIRDKLPAGFLHVSGDFFVEHRDEILGLLDHHAKKAVAEHALARVIGIASASDGDGDGMVLTTTDIHLARDLGEALHAAYRGGLEFLYNDAENLLRVHWWR